MFPDHHQGTGVRLDIVSRAQMIRIGVGLQDPGHLQRLRRRRGQHLVGPCGRNLAAAVVVVKHGVDHGRLPRHGIGHQIGHGVRGLVEESLDLSSGSHKECPALERVF